MVKILCACYHNKENKLGWKVVAGAGSSVNPWGSLVFICIMFAHAPSSGRHKAAGKVPPSLGGNAGQSSVEEGGGVVGSDAAPGPHPQGKPVTPSMRGHGRSPPLQMVFPMGIPAGFTAARSGAKRRAVTRDLR